MLHRDVVLGQVAHEARMGAEFAAFGRPLIGAGGISGAEGALDLGQEVVVVVEAGGGGELGFFDICRFVTLASAGRALLVALVAGERAGADRWTAGAAVFRRTGVAGRC